MTRGKTLAEAIFFIKSIRCPPKGQLWKPALSLAGTEQSPRVPTLPALNHHTHSMLSQAAKGRTRTETWTPFPGQQPCSLSLCSPSVCLIPPSAQSYVQRTEFRKQAYRKSIPNQMPYVCVDFDLQIKCPLSILSWEGHSSLRQLGWQVCHTFLLCSDTGGFLLPSI